MAQECRALADGTWIGFGILPEFSRLVSLFLRAQPLVVPAFSVSPRLTIPLLLVEQDTTEPFAYRQHTRVSPPSEANCARSECQYLIFANSPSPLFSLFMQSETSDR
jgi:hypothetical protein